MSASAESTWRWQAYVQDRTRGTVLVATAPGERYADAEALVEAVRPGYPTATITVVRHHGTERTTTKHPPVERAA